MAHNLNIKKDGTASFASTEKAWHGLGQIVKGAMTSKEAIELGGLDYQVIKKPLFTEVDGKKIEVANNFATLRSDNNDTLGVVGNRYEIVQNSDAFCFFDAIVGQKQAIFETAGALGKGERIFITAKMPKYIRIGDTDDVTEVYVILTNTHDGSGSVIAAITPVRIVCANTLRMALKNTINKVSIRHTKNVQDNLMEAHKLLKISNDYITEMQATVNALSLKKVSDKQVYDLVNTLFPSDSKNTTRIDNIKQEVLTSYFSGIGQEKVLGTAWGVLNGITHFTSHAKSYHSAESKFDNLIMDGTSTKLVDKALAELLAM